MAQSSPAVLGPVESSVRPASEARKCVQDCGPMQCKNMRCTYEGMDGERYRCEMCGESYFLDYEEMR